MITSYGKVTQEVVRAFEPPTWLAYSATNQSLGGMYTDHLGVLICEPEGTDKTRFQWRTYAQPAYLPFMRWLGKNVFKFVIEKSLKNLRKRFPV